MATATTVTPGLMTPRRFTVEEYHRMAEAGILGEDDRIELIDGEIIEMSPIGPAHQSTVDALTDGLVPRLRGRAIVRVQGSFLLTADGEPEPDILVLRPRADRYAFALPGPGDVLLIMEVAHSSLAYDRDVKALRYAAAGIPEYWLWDLIHRLLLVHRDPTPQGSRQLLTLRGADPISPLAFPDLVLTPDAVLPPASPQ